MTPSIRDLLLSSNFDRNHIVPCLMGWKTAHFSCHYDLSMHCLAGAVNSSQAVAHLLVLKLSVTPDTKFPGLRHISRLLSII